MNCPNCGNILIGNELFCGNCGSSISQSTFDQNEREVYSQVSDMVFVDKDEKIVASIGVTSGYITNWFFSDSFGKEICILTNKRIYYKGRKHTVSSGLLTSHTTESVIELNEVTDVSFYIPSKSWLLILGVALCGFSIVEGLSTLSDCGLIMTFAFFLPSLCVGAFCIAAFFLTKRYAISVKYSGNVLSFKSNNKIDDVREFQRAILSTKAELVNKEK